MSVACVVETIKEWKTSNAEVMHVLQFNPTATYCKLYSFQNFSEFNCFTNINYVSLGDLAVDSIHVASHLAFLAI